MSLPDPASAEEPAGPAVVLPAPVRTRVVGLAAEALGRLETEQVPMPLRRVASFAPARRARLGGSQIAAALAADGAFRARIGEQARTLVPQLAEALDSGTPPGAVDPVDLAALAYLLRPSGWVDLVDRCAAVVADEQAQSRRHQQADELERLHGRLETATADLKEARRRHRDELAALKADNTELRQRLGEARSRLREAESAAATAEQRRQQAESTVASLAAEHAAEVRRVRSRLEQVEAELTAARRTERAERGTESLRARLLLDTLLDSARALGRELALPPVPGAPADVVEAHLAETGTRTSGGHGSLAPDDPALLDELLALPRAHVVVDGYNVTKTAWPDLSLEQQRSRLLAGLAPLVARSGAELTVVFDAAATTSRPVVRTPRGVRVLFSSPGVIADDVIRELVAAEPAGRPVVVVTSDQAVVRDVVRDGARAVAAPALSRLLARG